MITLSEAKIYLRVDSADEDELIGSFLASAEALALEIARISPLDVLTEREMALLQVAIYHAVGYLYENRENANMELLIENVKMLLSGIRRNSF